MRINFALACLSAPGFCRLRPASLPMNDVYVTSDTCPDYTWGLSEKDTRTALAELVRANLDEMTRTDAQSTASRHRYNMAVTQEALVFLDRISGTQR